MRVPTYDGNQVRTAPLQPVQQRAPDVSSGLAAAGRGLAQVADAADAMAERDAQTAAFNAQARMMQDFNAWNVEARKNMQGANAKGYTANVEQWWKDAADKYGGELNPMAQRLASRALTQARVSALESAGNYENQQLDIGERSALQASTVALQGQAIAAGVGKAGPVLDTAAAQLRAWGSKKGVDMEPEVLKLTTGAHVTLINQLMQRDPKQAEAYFNTNKAQIDPAQWDNIGGKLNQVSAANDGEAKASELWQAAMGGKDYRQPVDLFALEKQMREAYPEDQMRQKAGIQALRDMTAAWNKSQAETNSGFVNRVYAMLDGGTPLSRVARSDAWASLPEQEQHRIRLQLEQEGAARESRLAAAEARQQRMLLLNNGAAFLRYSDPEVLARMSRTEVEATRSVFGLEGTQHLLAKFDALQKPNAIAEARMDNEDFNHVADSLGLKPFAQNKSEEEKRQLGELKFRTEQLISQAQQAKKQALTRDEKMELMRSEMARTVTVDPGWFSPNKAVPVIQLAPDQAQRVVVPQADKEQIAAALKQMAARDPNNPAYAPTEENMRRWYLARQSRAAGLIAEPKK